MVGRTRGRKATKKVKAEKIVDYDDDEVMESGSAQREEQEQEQDDDGDEEEEEEGEGYSPPKTMDELEESGMMNKAATYDDEDEEDEDSDGSEQPQDDMKTDKSNEMSGRLKSIEAVDFMCHRRMTVKLGSRINFITGANGSGKSAIIAALQICLGMGARQTHRGTNLSSLIRHGANGDAKVAVTLHNTGELAYYQEKFGDSITIERVLSKNGSSSYKLKTASGKVESIKKHAVDDVIEHFHLHVGNPCCILDQESSKAFLKGNASDKYKFFLKASLLESMQKEYADEKSTRRNAKEEMERQGKNTANLEKEVETAEKKLEQMEMMGKYEQRKQELSEQYMWRGALDAEEEAETFKTDLEKHERKLTTAKEKLTEAEKVVAALGSDNETVVADMNSTSAQFDDARNQSDQARQALQEASDGIGQHTLVMDRSRSQIAEYTKGIKSADKSIRNSRAELMRKNPEAEKQQILGQLNNCNQELEGLQTIDDDGRTVEEVNNAKEEALYEEKYKIDDQRKGCQEQTRICKQKILRCKNEIAQLVAQQKDATARFGRWVPKLLTLVEREARKFHQKPIHIGLHVDLLDSRFWRPIEQSLKEVLRSFTVTDSHDFAELKKLANQAGAGGELKVIVSRFMGRRHNIVHPDDSNLKTIESCLSISDDNAFNVLVDQAMIESTVLFKTSGEASRTLFKPTGNGTVVMPRNIAQGVDLENNQYTVARGSEMIQNFATGGNNTKSKYFAADASARIPECEQALKQAEYELAVHMKEAQRFQNAIQTVTQDLIQIQDSHKILTQRTRQIGSEIERLTQAQDKLQLDDGLESKIRGMEEYKIDLEKKIEDEKKSMAETAATQAQEQQVIGPLQQQCALADQRTHELERKLDEQRERLNDWQGQYQMAMASKEQAVNRVAKREEKLGGEREKYDKMAAHGARLREAALEFSSGTEVTPDGTVNVIKLELAKIEKRIQKERNRLREVSTAEPAVLLQQAKTNVQRAKDQLNTTREQIKLVKKRLKRLKQSNRARQKLWVTFRGRMQAKTNNWFTYYMSRRQHGGSLSFDDDNGKLVVNWQKSMNETQGESQESAMDEATMITDTKALSGGERSYTTVALLLSMGVIVDSPFRVMDEFDVFMDEVIRGEAIKQLVNAATEDGKQYLFITPHNIGDVEHRDDIRTFKMRPQVQDFGKSQQTTLNF